MNLEYQKTMADIVTQGQKFFDISEEFEYSSVTPAGRQFVTAGKV